MLKAFDCILRVVLLNEKDGAISSFADSGQKLELLIDVLMLVKTYHGAIFAFFFGSKLFIDLHHIFALVDYCFPIVRIINVMIGENVTIF